MKKIISVVIPTYNRSEKLLRALDSIYNQTAIECIGEIIVVDDGSTDDTEFRLLEYCKKHNNPKIIFIKQKNKGASSARNKGMSESHYPYIAFLDSDDMWLPNKIEMQVEVFEQKKDAGLIGGNFQDKPLRLFFKNIKSLHKATLLELMYKFYPVTPSIIIKKEIFNLVGGFDEDIHYYEDCDYFQKICALGYGYYYLPNKIVQLDDKAQFGERGLSSNLKAIYLDSIISLKKMKNNKYIGNCLYIFLRIYYFFKHLRRIIISKIRKKHAK